MSTEHVQILTCPPFPSAAHIIGEETYAAKIKEKKCHGRV